MLLLVALSCADDKVASTSGTAGQVIAVQGEVSATRPGEARRILEINNAVFNDDTIVTGPNSSVEVELAHNGARWQLSSDNERRVDTSLAWRAKRQSVAALDPNEQVKTGSAGRNTTREAAESAETLMREGGEAREMDPDPSSAAPAEPPSGAPAAARRPKRARAAPKPAPTADQAYDGLAEEPRQEAAPGRAAPSPPPPPPPPPSASAADSKSAPKREVLGASEARDGDSRDAEDDTAAPSLRSHVITEANRCHKKHGGSGQLVVTISAKAGKAGNLRVTGPEALEATRRCVESVLRSSVLPKGGPLSMTISLQ